MGVALLHIVEILVSVVFVLRYVFTFLSSLSQQLGGGGRGGINIRGYMVGNIYIILQYNYYSKNHTSR